MWRGYMRDSPWGYYQVKLESVLLLLRKQTKKDEIKTAFETERGIRSQGQGCCFLFFVFFNLVSFFRDSRDDGFALTLSSSFIGRSPRH